MEELATVVEDKGDKARVRVIRHSACHKCDKDCGMSGASHDVDNIEIEVNNNLDAAKGSMVKLEMGERTIVLASMIVYLFPLISLIGGYFVSNWIVSQLGYVSSEIIGITGGFIFLAMSFIVIRLIDLKLRMVEVFHPKMTKILN
jgi:sigma-E factor negative regulatory protein RseC